jgi:NADPH:quinone reductase-like Zn-dependent oxidoreductase
MFINNEATVPEISGSKALVRVKAFGLNRMDLMQRGGDYPLPAHAPKTMGVEFSGTIEELGPTANDGKGENFKIGDEVFGLAYGGAYAEYIAASTHMLMPKPKELSWEEAAGIPEVWITAIQALYLIGEFEKGKSILWHAGASGVSIAGIQLARAGGASAVYATARQDEKVEFCVKELGCKAAFNTTKEGWADEVMKATDGKGVDILVDFIGAPVFQDNMNVLARDGRIVSLAALGGAKLPAGVDIGLFWRKRIRIEGSGLRSRDEAYQGRLRDMLEEKALDKFKDKSFKVLIEKVMDWTQIVEAHQLMESNKTKGKIICTITW